MPKFVKGQSGNPSGRPRNTLKDYVSRKLRLMTDEEKDVWLKDNKLSAELIWRMAEGNPTDESKIKQESEVVVTSLTAKALEKLKNKVKEDMSRE